MEMMKQIVTYGGCDKWHLEWRHQMMKKRFSAIIMALLLLFSISACGEGASKKEIELDLDTIAETLCASGYFSDVMERVDSISVSDLLLLNEDRVEASPEDLVDSRYYGVTAGVTANQFILLEGADTEAADRLENALNTYVEDQKLGFESYFPEQAARFDDPIIERQGKYLLLAIGEDREPLADLCSRLMNGETE